MACSVNVEKDNKPILSEIVMPLESVQPVDENPTVNIYTVGDIESIKEYKINEDSYKQLNTDWSSYIREKFGIDINCMEIYTGIGNWMVRIDAVTIQAMYKMGYDQGLFVVESDVFREMIQNEELGYYFVSLSDLYEDLPELSGIPKSYTDMTVDIYGTTWGIAYNSNYSMMPGRFYNAGDLEKINKEAPRDINEFYETCLLLQKDNSKSTVLKTWYSGSNFMYQFSDILGAFGIYGNSISESFKSIQYNYKTDSFEDFMLDNNLRTALEFIRSLNSSGVIGTSPSGNFESDFANGSLRTFYSSLKKPERLRDSVAFVPYLTKSGIDTMYKYSKTDKIILVSKYTENPAQVVNNYTDLLLGGSSYADLLLGSKYIAEINGDWQLIKYNYNDIPFPPAVGLFDSLDTIYQPNNIANSDQLIYRAGVIRKIMENDSYETIYKAVSPLDYAGMNSNIIDASPVDLWSDIFKSKLLTNDISLDDLYEEYYREIKVRNGSDYLLSLNNKAGKAWKNHYE